MGILKGRRGAFRRFLCVPICTWVLQLQQDYNSGNCETQWNELVAIFFKKNFDFSHLSLVFIPCDV